MNKKSHFKTLRYDNNVSRRYFFKLVWKIIGVISLLEPSYVFFSLLRPSNKRHNAIDSNIVELDALQHFPINSVKRYMEYGLYVVRFQDGGVLALSSSCTHLNCPVNWSESKQQFLCPCHSSAFTVEGEVLNPPAIRPLSCYDIILSEGKMFVDLSMPLKRKKFNKNQLKYA
jgi:cytochrome b6-f complex iron-sulfur subunit